jgi:hypothetical protein
MTSVKKPVTKTGKLPKDIFGSTGAGAPKSEQELMKVLDQLTEAYVRADTEVINRIYADDCIITGSTGAVMTKADLVKHLKSGAVKYESYERDDLLLRLYGTTKSMSQGRESTGRSRVVTVWVKQGGKWRFVAGQGTPIPQ